MSTNRLVLNFNTDWLYHTGDVPGGESLAASDAHWTPVCLPHANIELPHHYFTEDDYRFVSWYRRHFHISEELRGKRLFIDFDGVMTVAQVYVNGHLLAEHKGGYTPFSVDITEHVKFGSAGNVLAVRVDSTRRPDVPPEGHVVDYMLFGGIYRNVHLRAVDPLHVDWAFVTTPEIDDTAATVHATVRIANQASRPRNGNVRWVILDGAGRMVTQAGSSFQFDAHSAQELDHDLVVADPKRWDVADPHLYTLQTEIVEDGAIVDTYSVRFGIRSARFAEDGRFYLNGRPLKLRGLNRHQMFPYVGSAMPDRLQRQDADILRYELGLNIVRTSHYPQAPPFLDRCDEIGLLIFEEIPGWQHIGGEAWKHLCYANIRTMITRDRNHPSIVLWGVRINESQDDHDFYTETNRLAHELDSTRQTGGVRYFLESEPLEDVFTFNDFSGGIQEPKRVPHLVTEFGGHMFPTKSYDNEERLVAHALYHAKVQNEQYGHPRVAGALGWCAFDYNTHVDFGSGDRICYHGVMDMFRFPKFAAYFHQSQIDPTERPVLFAATHWTQGDRSGGGINPLVVFSNCDEIDVYFNEALQQTVQPDREQYGNLPHSLCRRRAGCIGWGAPDQRRSGAGSGVHSSREGVGTGDRSGECARTTGSRTHHPSGAHSAGDCTDAIGGLFLGGLRLGVHS